MLSPVLWLKKWHCSCVGQDFIPSGIEPLERGWGGEGGPYSVCGMMTNFFPHLIDMCRCLWPSLYPSWGYGDGLLTTHCVCCRSCFVQGHSTKVDVIVFAGYEISLGVASGSGQK